MPSSVTKIDAYAFFEREKIKSIEIPASVDSIGKCAFNYCNNLTYIRIPKNVIFIGENALNNCECLTNIDVASDNPNYTSENGILYNKNKTEIICFPGGISGKFTIPSGVTKIRDYAFTSCEKLTYVEVPPNVTQIEPKAFYMCFNLDIVIKRQTGKKKSNKYPLYKDFFCCKSVTYTK